MKKDLKRFRVHEAASFFASKVIVAKTKNEALSEYDKSPCRINEFKYGSSEVYAEEETE